jgi:hypothetical protein
VDEYRLSAISIHRLLLPDPLIGSKFTVAAQVVGGSIRARIREPTMRFFNAYRIISLSAFNPDKYPNSLIDLKYLRRHVSRHIYCLAYLLFLSASTRDVSSVVSAISPYSYSHSETSSLLDNKVKKLGEITIMGKLET